MIIEEIRKHIFITKDGNFYTGNCPFCGDTKNSFTVHKARGFFHCFRCKASGDLETFKAKIKATNENP